MLMMKMKMYNQERRPAGRCFDMKNTLRQRIFFHNQLLILIFLLPVINGFIDTDGVCSLATFVPFSYMGRNDSGSMFLDNRTNYGFSQIAAALMAVEDFNNRNGTVVPELADLDDCNITLKMDNTSIFDTGIVTKMSSRHFYSLEEAPCAILGPFNDYPAMELSVMAQAAEVPMVIHRAFNPRAALDFFGGFTSQIYPDMLSSSLTLVSFLFGKKRTNYIALMYSWNPANDARMEFLSFHLDNNNVEFMSSIYVNPLAETGNTFQTSTRSPLAALRRIKDSGYRTIVVAMDSPWTELQAIADAAEELEMNQGDYFWIWYDVFEATFALVLSVINDNVTKLTSGSAWTMPIFSTDTFDAKWRGQGKLEVDRLNAANPISPGRPGYKFAEDDFFQSVGMESGCNYIYDAVVSVGIGACLAQGNDGRVSSADHVSGIRQASFTGASDKVKFGDRDGNPDRYGLRDSSTVTWIVVNFLPDGNLTVTDVLTPDSNGTWDDKWRYSNGTVEQFPPFVFRDGRKVPPDRLRDEGDQNYLSYGLSVLGLTLMSLAISIAVVSAIWVFVRRKHRVVVASQPVFLYLICFGAFLTASSIFTMTFDENHGWTEEQLSKSCMATPWLLTLGFTIIYGSLFTKMWRVHKVLQFTNRGQIKLSHVAWPMLGLIVLNLLVLIVWTTLDPLVWQRVEDEETADSIGECSSQHMAIFVVTIAILSIVSMVATLFFAWKTKDVDDTYTESRWVFMMILVQLEVIVISIPVVILLQGLSTNGRYLGYTILFWIISMSTLGFIMLPKYLSYRRTVRGVDGNSRPKRGERANGRVTGFKRKKSETQKSSGEAITMEMVPERDNDGFRDNKEG